MSQLFDTYNLTITVLTPVHIGTGEKLGDKEILNTKNQVLRIDEQALFEKVAQSPQLLSSFEAFCLDRRAKFHDFLKNSHIDPLDITLYKLERYGNKAYRNYAPYIKIPGEPPIAYIPGSSIKGAFRTVALRGSLIGNRKWLAKANAILDQQGGSSRGNNKKYADNAIEELFFGRDQHHEWMRLWQFTDTDPIPLTRLAATETRILSVQTGNSSIDAKTRDERPIVTHPEILIPETRIQGQLNINRYLLNEVAKSELELKDDNASIEYLIRYANKVTREFIKKEYIFAKSVNWRGGQCSYNWLLEQLEKLNPDTCLLRIGGGTGFESQTITDLMEEETFKKILNSYKLSIGHPRNNRRIPRLPKKFVPKSRQVALDKKGQWLPLGWVKVQMRPRED